MSDGGESSDSDGSVMSVRSMLQHELSEALQELADAKREAAGNVGVPIQKCRVKVRPKSYVVRRVFYFHYSSRFLTCSPTTHRLARSPTRSLAPSLPRSLPPSLPHSFTPSLPHFLTPPSLRSAL